MINFLSSWAKTLSLSVIIVSILEMLLPNNKTKKYIRMIMGIYILFNIISPFIKNVQAYNIENVELEEFSNKYQTSTNTIDQSSMDSRLKQLYIEQLEKDVSKKIKDKGYDVLSCKVDAVISGDEKQAGIKKIILKLEKNENNLKENNQDIEEKLIDEVDKIKDINISAKSKTKNDKKISDRDKNNLKKFLKEEYGVDEKCLKID
ncbi:MAG: stage III sporulation protein AF [Clostridia bacterium]|nr:stage III sporulation protein AF [Clostridia bacterium]